MKKILLLLLVAIIFGCDIYEKENPENRLIGKWEAYADYGDNYKFIKITYEFYDTNRCEYCLSWNDYYYILAPEYIFYNYIFNIKDNYLELYEANYDFVVTNYTPDKKRYEFKGDYLYIGEVEYTKKY